MECQGFSVHPEKLFVVRGILQSAVAFVMPIIQVVVRQVKFVERETTKHVVVVNRSV